MVDDFSETFEQGQTTTLVGVAGSGKSTVAFLIERLYDCSHGSITIDGEPIKKINLKVLRKQISSVTSSTTFFHNLTIK